MKHITATFLKGLFTLLPLLISVYALTWFLALVEDFARRFLLVFWPEFLYLPGMGIAIVFLLIYGFGTVVDKPLTRWLFNLVDGLLRELPVVKTVYLAIKDFTDYLRPSKERSTNQVVLVRFPGSEMEIIGLMTRSDLKDAPEPVTKENRVAVYLPMSYQFGGYTVFIPRSWVHTTDLPVEVAMRSIITAWLPGGDKKLENL